MLNLARPRSKVQLLMRDTVVITKDTMRMGDATLNPATGVLTDNPANTTTVYTGKAFIERLRPMSRPEAPAGGEERARSVYTVALPFGSPVLSKGLIVRVTVAEDDALKVGAFTIIDTDMETMSFWRAATMERIETDRD